MRSFLIDGEAVACDGEGMPSFDRLRYRRADAAVFLFAFDLLEINGQDLRREPLEMRKRKLGSCYVGLPKLACNSTNISLSPATSSSATPVSSASKASSRSASVRPIAPAALPIG